MTRPKMVLVPETAVRDLATLPVANCGTCENATESRYEDALVCIIYGANVRPSNACVQWEPKA